MWSSVSEAECVFLLRIHRLAFGQVMDYKMSPSKPRLETQSQSSRSGQRQNNRKHDGTRHVWSWGKQQTPTSRSSRTSERQTEWLKPELPPEQTAAHGASSTQLVVHQKSDQSHVEVTKRTSRSDKWLIFATRIMDVKQMWISYKFRCLLVFPKTLSNTYYFIHIHFDNCLTGISR